MATTRISDVVVPEIFSPYVLQLSQEKSRLVQSGAVTLDARLSQLLSGGGLMFNEPFFRDLKNEEENVSNDDPGQKSTPKNMTAASEVQVRLSRNNSWSSMDLTADLIGADPMSAIATRVSSYWAKRLQAAFIATMKGVFADNAAAPSGTEHVQNDMTFNVSGSSYTNGVTNFSAAAFIDTTATMGDSMESLGMIMVHSVVYARMLKNNLIDFIPVSINNQAVTIATFLGREVIVDDSMPNKEGVFDSWLFGSGAIQLGMGLARVPTEIERSASAGNGGGQETLYSRQEWCIHPTGYAYVGTAAHGGPSNADSTNNLANADSWKRVFPERKQIQIARLVTREY